MTHPQPPASVSVVENTTVTRALTVAGCILAAWIPVLYLRMTAQHADPATATAWVGLDVVELAALTVLVRAAGRRAAHTRVAGIVAAALFVLDAVSDVASATTTNSLAVATVMAIGAELPVALGCLRLALTQAAPPPRTAPAAT